MPGKPTDNITDALWDKLLVRDPAALRAAPLYGALLREGGTAPGQQAGGAACDSEAGRPQASATASLTQAGIVLGRIAQSLDGRIATDSGRSRWISGEADLLHTHRLRALFDAVVVGAGTVRADDPLLTTRSCRGPSPVRVVIDTDRRLGPDYQVFRGGPATLLLCADDAPHGRCGDADLMRLPRYGGGLDIPAIIAALRGRGLHRIFVEGGGITVSRFLAAGCLNRLHVTIAPLLLGAGIPAFTLPGVACPQDGMRLEWTVHRLGRDLLLDIPLERRACLPPDPRS